MIRFKHYKDSNSMGNGYIFGLNIYRDMFKIITIDLIIGRHVFVTLIGRYR